MNILITGGNGFVASQLVKYLPSGYNIMSVTRQDFDLTAFEAMNNFFQGKYFDAVIHCAVQGGSRLKEDTYRDMDVNLTSYYNLLQHKSHYGKLIYFGSGAEIHSPESPYGLSKRIIAKSVSEIPNFYNLRIYGVFGESELESRFIRGNVKRYIDKQPLQIHQDKFMDFFYIKDLAILVDHYIQNTNVAKEVNCSYSYVWSLGKIADFINNLGDHKVDINYVEQGFGKGYHYNGVNYLPDLDFIGLEKGIKEVYNNLK